ncbi:riboflavin synthase [Sinomicrobium weinanense]|uniref:Riboflavin synthase n=1 Tax=Sinomicrobium weinanense TaxID=2842200 RepID=A0A926Q194_9FLAO|nr:riboflavin synthase [Sinomicrobium weinanense]MBC9794604.1 riboflavin synthase [Sinomicrobium weinanense]MBU3124089.1 riboflavin synthase [Sinomicrobium weinanense]
MFTGIVEEFGTVTNLAPEKDNLHISIKSNIASELKIDQSVSHNGVCLTVVSVNGDEYTVTAIRETLERSCLGQLKKGDTVNLERAMKLGDRLDGHIVQGHVDQTAMCSDIKNVNGSWLFTFTYDASSNNITIEKGSITIDGTSLTVVDSGPDSFSVAIIPYTYEHTNFRNYKIGTEVNLEFDVVGKYVARLLELHK